VITTTLKIDGMHCKACAERLAALLSKEPGVREAPVSFADGAARLRFNPRIVSEKRLVEVVEQSGFTVVVPRQ
jgi:copper chaperone